MKLSKYLTLIFFFSVNILYAQDTTKKQITTDVGIDITSANVFRGVRFGTSSSIIGYTSISKNNFKLTASSYHTLGQKSGYDNGFNFYITYIHKNLSFSLDEYIFMYDLNKETWYDEYTEFRSEYEINNNKYLIALTTRGTYIGSNSRINDNTALYYNNKFKLPTFYFESRIKMIKNIFLQAGFVTNASGLNFYGNGDKYNAGFTNIGIISEYNIINRKLPIELGFVYNPKANQNLKMGGVSQNYLLFYGKIRLN